MNREAYVKLEATTKSHISKERQLVRDAMARLVNEDMLIVQACHPENRADLSDMNVAANNERRQRYADIADVIGFKSTPDGYAYVYRREA